MQKHNVEQQKNDVTHKSSKAPLEHEFLPLLRPYAARKLPDNRYYRQALGCKPSENRKVLLCIFKQRHELSPCRTSTLPCSSTDSLPKIHFFFHGTQQQMTRSNYIRYLHPPSSKIIFRASRAHAKAQCGTTTTTGCHT